MHYQLWDTASANVIDVYRTEAESLAMVRGLLEAGWNADHLALGLDFDVDEPGDDADLPPSSAGLPSRRAPKRWLPSQVGARRNLRGRLGRSTCTWL